MCDPCGGSACAVRMVRQRGMWLCQTQSYTPQRAKAPISAQGGEQGWVYSPPERVTVQLSPVLVQPKQEGPARPGRSLQEGAHWAARVSVQASHSICGEAENSRSTDSTTLLLLVQNVHSQRLSTFCSKHVRAVDFGQERAMGLGSGTKGPMQ